MRFYVLNKYYRLCCSCFIIILFYFNYIVILVLLLLECKRGRQEFSLLNKSN